MKWCVAACLVVAALLFPSRASACSCGSFDRPTPESCGAAKRVFAGTVTAYHWPNAVERYLVDRWTPVGVELAVDRVWKSAVPERVFTATGMGGGDCGIQPPVGTRYVVCDDEADDAAPDYLFCSHPQFAAPELEAALGASHAPEPWPVTPPCVGLLVGALVVAGAAFVARRRAA